jgi:hypothetical protein
MRVSFLLLVFALFAISCSKHPPEEDYFRGTLNGVSFSDPIARINPNTGDKFVITAFAGPGYDNFITLQCIGTTGEHPVDQNNVITVDGGGYFQFFQAGPSFTSPGKVQGSGVINIVEITSSYIKGFFECAAPADSTSNSNLQTQIITRGEFKLRRPL